MKRQVLQARSIPTGEQDNQEPFFLRFGAPQREAGSLQVRISFVAIHSV